MLAALRASSVAITTRELIGLAAPLQARGAKKSKRKKRPKRADRPQEAKDNSSGPPVRIFDNIMNPETPYQMSQTIRRHMRGLESDGRHNRRRYKDR
eukprot:g22782.t1